MFENDAISSNKLKGKKHDEFVDVNCLHRNIFQLVKQEWLFLYDENHRVSWRRMSKLLNVYVITRTVQRACSSQSSSFIFYLNILMLKISVIRDTISRLFWQIIPSSGKTKRDSLL